MHIFAALFNVSVLKEAHRFPNTMHGKQAGVSVRYNEGILLLFLHLGHQVPLNWVLIISVDLKNHIVKQSLT